MAKYNAFLDIELMKGEYSHVFDNLKNGTPVASHIWVIIRQSDVPDGEWTADNLASFCEHFDSNDTLASAHMVWCANAEAGPGTNRKFVIGDKEVLKRGTPVNLTDFILACTQSIILLAQYHTAVINLIAFPWRHVLKNSPELVADLNNTLVALVPDKEENVGLPHADAGLQEKEYERVFSALEKGELIPSHWQLYLSFKGDDGGPLWDLLRIKRCLKAMLDSDECGINVVWMSEPMHVIEELERHDIRGERGAVLGNENKPDYLLSASPINLSDFIWLCCKQRDIVYGRYALAVLMVALYPFRHAIKGDKRIWLEKTHGRLKMIHLATLEHIKH